MITGGVNIRDLSSLEQLNNMIEYSGEAMANIEENVSNYIDKVYEVLEKQLNLIEEQLNKAKEELRAAQDELSACEASQEYDEESKEYHPSCRWEESAVQSARKEVDEWQRKYDEAKRIVDECKNEIEDYNYSGGLLYPPGGHYLIVNMRKKQVPHATEQLREHIENAKDVLSLDLGGDNSTVNNEIANPYVNEEDLPRSEDEKLSAFRNAIQGVKQEQSAESYYRNIQDANRAMRCPSCGMPLALCTCKNLHGDVHLYDKV